MVGVRHVDLVHLLQVCSRVARPARRPRKRCNDGLARQRPESVQAPDDRGLAGCDPSPDPGDFYEGVAFGDVVVRRPHG